MTRLVNMLSPLVCGHPVRKSKPVELGKRKREPLFMDHDDDDLNANPEAWIETKRLRMDRGECFADVAHMDDRDQYPTAPTYVAFKLDSGEWDEDDGELVDDRRFYRNTDFWMVGSLSDKLEYSGALFSNRQFAIEQMQLRLQQEFEEEEKEVAEATQNGLLATMVSTIQRLASLRLPFFG